jgi:glutamine amidotransferase
MCRWLAYSGPPIHLSELLTRPEHSLIDQSRHARQNVETTNGDGFGVGWYGPDGSPATYHETHPAWNDANLQSLANHVESGLFLSHVRAATGTPVQKTNCHPFAFENWLFQHNGSVPEFGRLKRELVLDVDADLYPHITGSTDSEALFFLALTFGLRDDPAGALARTMGRVERARTEAGIEKPIFFSACVTDGLRLWAVRYSSHSQSRTLYHSVHAHALREVDQSYAPLPEGAMIVLSEPLDDLANHWQAVPESSLVVVADGGATITDFSPETS